MVWEPVPKCIILYSSNGSSLGRKFKKRTEGGFFKKNAVLAKNIYKAKFKIYFQIKSIVPGIDEPHLVYGLLIAFNIHF